MLNAIHSTVMYNQVATVITWSMSDLYSEHGCIGHDWFLCSEWHLRTKLQHSGTGIHAYKACMDKHHHPIFFSYAGYLDRIQLPGGWHQFSTLESLECICSFHQSDSLRSQCYSAMKAASISVIWRISKDSCIRRKIIQSNAIDDKILVNCKMNKTINVCL